MLTKRILSILALLNLFFCVNACRSLRQDEINKDDFLRAKGFFETGNFSQAIDILDRLNQKTPNSETVIDYLAQAYVAEAGFNLIAILEALSEKEENQSTKNQRAKISTEVLVDHLLEYWPEPSLQAQASLTRQ